MVLNVFPGDSPYNLDYALPTDTKFIGQCINTFAARKLISNINNLFFGEFKISGIFTFFAATLGRHISLIFGHGSDSQMPWINARRIITSMHDNQAFWNFAIRNGPCHSMGKSSFSFITKLPISAPVMHASSPKPTCFGFINFIPEALHEWLPNQRLR